jgi:drug/metabolite transporter (DMT)-like permease
LFVLLSVLWGLSFPAISVGLESLPPLLFAAFRYDVAAVLLLAVAAAGTDSDCCESLPLSTHQTPVSAREAPKNAM